MTMTLRALVATLLICASAIPTSVGASTFERDLSFSGTGAWRFVFDVEADHDLSLSAIASDASGEGAGAPAGGPTGRVLAAFQGNSLIASGASFGTSGLGDVVYLSLGPQRLEVGPLGSSDEGHAGWSGYGVEPASGRLEIVFAYSSPLARLQLHGSWTRGVQLVGEGPLEGTTARRVDEMQGLAAAGVEIGPSVAISRKETIPAVAGVVGFFDEGAFHALSLRTCRAPDGVCAPPGSPPGIVFGRDAGDWEFEIDAQASITDSRMITLLVVPLPGSA